MILWKKKIVNKPITLESFGYSDSNHCSCIGLSLTSQFLSSLKLALENKFSRTSNSHFMRVPIIAIIEFLGISVAYFYNADELYTIP